MPLKLLVTFHQDGTVTSEYVEMTPAEVAQMAADEDAWEAGFAAELNALTNSNTIRAELQSQLATALALADLIRDNAATPAQQRQAVELVLRGMVRLAKVVYRTYDVPA
jgi:hypothetical protein